MAKGNSKLNEAKVAKNDEFYTQYDDIQNEINAYIEYNPDVFRDKVVLLPCDDPEWSNFTKFFVNNFRAFGLKKLISTSYAVESKHYKEGYQPSLFETSAPQYDEDKTRTHGKIFVLEKDINDDGVIDVNDLQWDYPDKIGIMSIKSANQWVDDALEEPDPKRYFYDLLVEGECTVIIAASNTGKSIFTTQMAEAVARENVVLYLDCELSSKQFQMRYVESDTHVIHRFPDTLLRAELRPEDIVDTGLEQAILDSIAA